MKGKSSSRVRAIDIMETPSKSKEEPQLSGAYIRSLVKHLSSSAKSPKDQTFKDTNSPKSILEEPQPLKSPPPPTNPKKQVRRRLHTSRPYQERLLNMAEARREIVTALKYHRASMKQANEQLQQIQSHPPPSNPNPINYQPLLPLPYPTLAPLPDMHDDFNFSFMNYQPLGLNLNFQGFNNIDATIVNVGNNKDVVQTQPSSPHSSSSSSYSYSPPPNICANVNYGGVSTDYGDANMHIAMGEKEMEEIRTIGEKHEIEWNDTMNLVNSARWSNFLEVDSMDDGINELRSFCEGNMDANASHLNDGYLQDSSLPCLDIGEIEWSEGDWLI